ncbi:MAG: ATP-binding cassette domain-containing protein [Thiolinea sp.]
MLQVDELKFRWKEQAFHYDFRLAAGSTLAIQGRSGIGKSTLLELIAGFIHPDSGDIRWQGQSLLPLSVEQRPVSMLFQTHNLFEHISVLQNLQLGWPERVNRERDSRIRSAAGQLGVGELLLRSPASLSGGQRQRIALLRTLLRPEPLVLLDEPFTGLDSTTRQQALTWVRETAQAQNKTLLLVTHQDEDVRQLADQVLVLEGNV